MQIPDTTLTVQNVYIVPIAASDVTLDLLIELAKKKMDGKKPEIIISISAAVDDLHVFSPDFVDTWNGQTGAAPSYVRRIPEKAVKDDFVKTIVKLDGTEPFIIITSEDSGNQNDLLLVLNMQHVISWTAEQDNTTHGTHGMTIRSRGGP